jgi:hypothetical protein
MPPKRRVEVLKEIDNTFLCLSFIGFEGKFLQSFINLLRLYWAF